MPGSEDVAIAADICARTGMRHQVEALASLDGLTPEEAYAECAEASVRLEGMADPLALAALTMAERRSTRGTGSPGSAARWRAASTTSGGPRDTAVTRARVARLAAWRMFANEAVDPDALAPSCGSGRGTRAVDRIHADGRSGKDWLAATDDFYLEQRMQRWAGVTETAVCLDRSVVNPMLDDRFIAIAQGMAPASKRGSLFLARLQMALDPELGRMPLDGRPPPRGVRPTRPRQPRASAATLARKASRKARQRVGVHPTAGRGNRPGGQGGRAVAPRATTFSTRRASTACWTSRGSTASSPARWRPTPAASRSCSTSPTCRVRRPATSRARRLTRSDGPTVRSRRGASVAMTPR